MGGIKLVLDGSIQGYTAYLSKPYHIQPGSEAEREADLCGSDTGMKMVLGGNWSDTENEAAEHGLVPSFFPIHVQFWGDRHRDIFLGPEQTISPYEAFVAVTKDAAWQYFEEDRKGTLEPGNLADLVVLSDDPFTIDPMKFSSIRVVETIKKGKIFHGIIQRMQTVSLQRSSQRSQPYCLNRSRFHAQFAVPFVEFDLTDTWPKLASVRSHLN